MPTCFCPHSACAAKIPYDAVKPTICPRCKQAFADAFRAVAPVAPPLPTRAAVRDDPDDQPLTRSALSNRHRAGITTVAKPRAHRGEDPELMANVMNPPPPDEPDAPVFADDPEDDTYDPRAAHRLARELAANIDPSTILIEDQDEGTVRFGDLVAQAKRTPQPAAKATKRRR